MSFKIEDFDDEAVNIKPPGFFYLWCCDCELRHIVFVDVVRGKVKIGLTSDNRATQLARKLEKITVRKAGKRVDR